MAEWQRAIIVGASSGIGEALALELAKQGSEVALVARREGELRRVADRILAQNPGGKALTYAHDVKHYAEVATLFPQIVRDLGGLDLIVYASGILPHTAEGEYNFDKDYETIEVNLLGGVAWINEAAQRFAKAEAGTIVGLSSVAGERGRYSMPIYCTSKAALNTYLEAIRNRVARHGVKVATVKLGPVKTPMTDGLKMPLMIPVEKAVEGILAAARHGAGNAYVPGVWRFIFLILRNVPSFIFRKLKL
ncbi:MAG: SDR family NAD(P)-dependent oxidoreductase [Chthonomonadaceae bacterium]|nr:SDR family NAD(P)-dependent oxidoreductase [Chthonomonadaceae bacterium]